MEKLDWYNVIDTNLVLENISHCVFVTDNEGVVQYWNRAGEELFGYSKNEIRGSSIAMLYRDENQQSFLDHIDELRDGRQVCRQVPVKKKNGVEFWVDICSRWVKDGANNHEFIISSVHDIQEKLETRKQLSVAEARAMAILENTAEGIVTTDKNGIIQSFNKAAEKIFGYRAEEAIGENVSILMPSPYRENHDRYMENYLATGQKKIIGIGREVTGRRKDGTVFPMDLSVSELVIDDQRIFTGIIRDISERRKLESEILEISEDEQRKIGLDLHDGLGQLLTGLGLISKNVAEKLEEKDVPEAKEVREISELIKEADEQAKVLARGLVHFMHGDDNLEFVLQEACKQARRLFDISCEFKNDSDRKIRNRKISLNLYRITQEAIRNAVKHGKATAIKVKLGNIQDNLELVIEDNGVGFSNIENIKKKKGMGVNIMHYRANTLGGKMHIEESENTTKVICTVPFPTRKTELKEN